MAVGLAVDLDARDDHLVALEGPAVDDLVVAVEDGLLAVGDDGEGVVALGVGADQVALLAGVHGLELVAVVDGLVELLAVEQGVDQVVGVHDRDHVVAHHAVVLVDRELDAGEAQVGEAPGAVVALGQDQGVPAAVELLTLVDDPDGRGGELGGVVAVHVGLDGLAEQGRLPAVHAAGRLHADDVDVLGAELRGDELEGHLEGVDQLDLAVLAGAVLGADLDLGEVLVHGEALDRVGRHAVVGLAVGVTGGHEGQQAEEEGLGVHLGSCLCLGVLRRFGKCLWTGCQLKRAGHVATHRGRTSEIVSEA